MLNRCQLCSIISHTQIISHWLYNIHLMQLLDKFYQLMFIFALTAQQLLVFLQLADGLYLISYLATYFHIHNNSLFHSSMIRRIIYISITLLHIHGKVLFFTVLKLIQIKQLHTLFIQLVKLLKHVE
jgi:hypothetical protein